MVSFPYNWFWIADDGRVYSSASQSISNDADFTFIEWHKDSAPTRWPENDAGEQTNAELAKVLAPYGLLIGSITDLKAMLKATIDRDAETERLKYITLGQGQAMTYQQKVAEALAFKAAAKPKSSDYPILSSEVGITAETIAQVVEIVLAAFAQWQQIGAAIESIRLGAKRDIDAIDDEAAARAIADAIVWPSEKVQP